LVSVVSRLELNAMFDRKCISVFFTQMNERI
jgi:hypothetical protein